MLLLIFSVMYGIFLLEKQYFKKTINIYIQNYTITVSHEFGIYKFATNRILTILHRFKKLETK